jgi:hypothetical protein
MLAGEERILKGTALIAAMSATFEELESVAER